MEYSSKKKKARMNSTYNVDNTEDTRGVPYNNLIVKNHAISIAMMTTKMSKTA